MGQEDGQARSCPSTPWRSGSWTTPWSCQRSSSEGSPMLLVLLLPLSHPPPLALPSAPPPAPLLLPCKRQKRQTSKIRRYSSLASGQMSKPKASSRRFAFAAETGTTLGENSQTNPPPSQNLSPSRLTEKGNVSNGQTPNPPTSLPIRT